MNAFAGKKAFWKNNAFWVVGMPTVLVGLVFLMAMVASVAG
jgi:hypothetical protein